MDLSQVIPLDVSELEPPQPMHKITATLQRLTIGEVLVVKHRRIPVPLFEMLTGRFEYQCEEITPFHFQLYFWQIEDNKAKLLIETLKHEKYLL